MAAESSLLGQLRSHSNIDCDTLDHDVIETLGPFVDCTSNQALAFAELQKPGNARLVRESVESARTLLSEYNGVSLEELAVDLMMIDLSARSTPHLTGYAHIQVNPLYTYNTQQILNNARRIVNLYTTKYRSFPSDRVCIKIPTTWEGMQASRELQKQGIATLATTLFSMEQAALAAEVGCTYIAPYINSLRTHFEAGYKDVELGFDVAWSAQRYFGSIGSKTQVLAASLTSVDEVMQLSGLHHITISASLLAELSSTPASSTNGDGSDLNLHDLKDEPTRTDYRAVVSDEASFRIAFTLDKGGASEKKLVEAINIFAKMQQALEKMVTDHPAYKK